MRGVAVQVAVLLGVAVDVAVGFEDCPPWTSSSSEAAFPLSRLGEAGADLGAARGGVAATVEKERGRESGTEGTSVVGTGRFWHLHGLVRPGAHVEQACLALAQTQFLQRNPPPLVLHGQQGRIFGVGS